MLARPLLCFSALSLVGEWTLEGGRGTFFPRLHPDGARIFSGLARF
jgi:hypothetical protein